MNRRVCVVIVLCFPLATLVKGPERKRDPRGMRLSASHQVDAESQGECCWLGARGRSDTGLRQRRSASARAGVQMGRGWETQEARGDKGAPVF